MVKQLQEEITNLKLELANASVTINNSISTNEKIEILSNYFKGRDDLYSVLQIDSKDNTKNIMFLFVLMNGKVEFVIKRCIRNVRIVNIKNMYL